MCMVGSEDIGNVGVRECFGEGGAGLECDIPEGHPGINESISLEE